MRSRRAATLTAPGVWSDEPAEAARGGSPWRTGPQAGVWTGGAAGAGDATPRRGSGGDPGPDDVVITRHRQRRSRGARPRRGTVGGRPRSATSTSGSHRPATTVDPGGRGCAECSHRETELRLFGPGQTSRPRQMSMPPLPPQSQHSRTILFFVVPQGVVVGLHNRTPSSRRTRRRRSAAASSSPFRS